MNLVFASGFLVPQAVQRLDYFWDLPQKYPGALFLRWTPWEVSLIARRNSLRPAPRPQTPPRNSEGASPSCKRRPPAITTIGNFGDVASGR